METSYIITFIGDDRPGLVEQLATAIESNGGNWHESRLSQLGGKFAGLIEVSLPESSKAALEATVKGLSDSGISVRITPTSSAYAITAPRTINLSVIGPDRPGIIREISQALSSHQVNVVELESKVISAPMSGEMLFEASIEAHIPKDTKLDELGEILDAIANQMTLDIDIEYG